MAKHKKRLEHISRFALPPRGSDEWNTLRRAAELPGHDHEVEHFAKRIWRAARAHAIAQLDNGTRLPADESLRHFVNEYNGRIIKHGIEKQPSSFNIMEAFLEFSPVEYFFSLREQLDHKFALEDFLDRITDGSVEEKLQDAAEHMKSGTIYNFETATPPPAFVLRDGDREFAFGGASLVRHGTELSVMLVAGIKADLAKRTRDFLESGNDYSAAPGKEGIKPADDLVDRAEPLDGTLDFHRLVVLTRFDLKRSSTHVRHLMVDWGKQFLTISDNPEIYEPFDDSYAGMLESAHKQLVEYATLFELCKTLIWVAAYFARYGEHATEERYRTRYADNASKLSYADIKKHAPPRERIASRRVAVLLSTRPPPTSDARTTLVPPGLKMETTGYWRNVSPTQYGEDAQGRPVLGRTWVTQHLSWVESDVPGSLVTRQPTSLPSGPDPGWIYVMRSPFHPRDVYKIGLTRHNTYERARQLSGTGSPEGFLVIHDWPTGDCVSVERDVHARLAQYRFNPSREFFAVDFNVIRLSVQEAIHAHDSGA